MSTLRAIRDDAGVLFDDWQVFAENLAEAPSDLEARRTEVGDLRSRAKAIRVRLDVLDIETALSVDDAELAMRFLQWERAVRFRCAQLQAYSFLVEDRIGLLVDGVEETARTLRVHETVQHVAQATLGSWESYPEILDASGLKASDIPLAPGTKLTIPIRREGSS